MTLGDLLRIKHPFTEVKFTNSFRSDFSGGRHKAADPENEYLDEVFDYDEKKQDLVLDRVPDITRDTISFKETLTLLELHATQKLHARKIFKIETSSPPIFERPMLTRHNFQKSEAY